MTFYLHPPSGDIALRQLELYATSRCRLLLRLAQCDGPSDRDDVLQDADVVGLSHCIIAGTPKDSVSHYILRLMLGGDKETASFFIKAEKSLFMIRLENMVEEEWIVFFKTLEKGFLKSNRNVSKPQSSSDPVGKLQAVCRNLKSTFGSWSRVAGEVCCGEPGGNVSNIYLAFDCVFSLVAARQVELNRGVATVPISHLRHILSELFESHLVEAVKLATMSREEALQEERLQYLARVLKKECRVQCGSDTQWSSCDRLRLRDLRGSVSRFPPCMARLMGILARRHRLGHHDRIQLTLFLKDLGLTVHDALLMWKREFSAPGGGKREFFAPGSGQSNCGHTWDRDAARYTYNIRHLYGLEGSCKDYCGHNCATLQTRSAGEGRCPFVQLHEDTQENSDLLQSLRPGAAGTVQALCADRQYGKACGRFLAESAKSRFHTSAGLSVTGVTLHEATGGIATNDLQDATSICNPTKNDLLGAIPHPTANVHLDATCHPATNDRPDATCHSKESISSLTSVEVDDKHHTDNQVSRIGQPSCVCHDGSECLDNNRSSSCCNPSASSDVTKLNIRSSKDEPPQYKCAAVKDKPLLCKSEAVKDEPPLCKCKDVDCSKPLTKSCGKCLTVGNSVRTSTKRRHLLIDDCDGDYIQRNTTDCGARKDFSAKKNFSARGFECGESLNQQIHKPKEFYFMFTKYDNCFLDKNI